MIYRQGRLLFASTSNSRLSPPFLPSCIPPRGQEQCRLRSERRQFAHVSRPSDHWPIHPNPTPYDIFNISRDSAYTKARFFELVKLYHPDRHCHHDHAPYISPEVKTERYRLVVLANDILSDPEKRRAYDLCGTGWTHRTLNHDEYKNWRTQEGTAASNATWEDWERWHDARNGKRPEPVYMSHGSFAALVVAFVSLGVVAQTNRIDARTKERLKAMQEQHDALNADMNQRKASAKGLSREERVERFIREQENARWAYQASN